MASLSKSELADYIWNNGILPLLSYTKIANRSVAYKLTEAEVASTSFTQTKGSWSISQTTGTVKGPAGYQARDSDSNPTGRGDYYPSSDGIQLGAVTTKGDDYWYTSNPYDGAPIGCTIYGRTGPQSNGTYGSTSYSPKLVVSTTEYPAVNASDAYDAYIDYLTALGLFDTSYTLS